MKRWLAAMGLCLLFCLCMTGAVMAGQAWEEDAKGWRYQLEDGTYAKDQWLFAEDNWFYFNRDGYMVTGDRRVGGEYYFFKDSGSMAVGWYHDEESDEWRYYEEDGTRGRGWLGEDGAWYWLNSSGTMIRGGYRSVDGHRYYFYDNGQLAANQYVGTYYFDENGLRDKRYDIVISGDRKPTQQEKDRITEALKNVPRSWIREFVDMGWKMMFYTDKSFFSAPDTEAGVYYVYHKVDTDYKKLKFTNPDSLTRAFGEYVGYDAGCFRASTGFQTDFYMLLNTMDSYNPLPGYFSEDVKAQFGVMFECFVDPDLKEDFLDYGDQLYRLMAGIVHRYDEFYDIDEEIAGEEVDDGGPGSVRWERKEELPAENSDKDG